MISDNRTQNIIIVTILIAGIVSGLGLASSAAWYSGSYSIVRYLEIDLTDIRVTNLNETDPGISAYFNVEAPLVQTGEAQLTYFTMVLYLNGDKLSYTSFRRDVPTELRTVYPGYNETFRIGSTITIDTDKQVLYDAVENDEWVFSIQLTVFYDIFDSPGDQVRIIAYSYNGPPSGLEG